MRVDLAVVVFGGEGEEIGETEFDTLEAGGGDGGEFFGERGAGSSD